MGMLDFFKRAEKQEQQVEQRMVVKPVAKIRALSPEQKQRYDAQDAVIKQECAKAVLAEPKNKGKVFDFREVPKVKDVEIGRYEGRDEYQLHRVAEEKKEIQAQPRTPESRAPPFQSIEDRFAAQQQIKGERGVNRPLTEKDVRNAEKALSSMQQAQERESRSRDQTKQVGRERDE